MTWLGLGELVAALRKRAGRLSLSGDLRLDAALLAADRVGHDTLLEIPAMVNVAALALAGAARPVLHQIRPAAARLVLETDLHSLPAEPPRLLRLPWLVEVRRPETGEVLWGEASAERGGTVALGGYELNGVRYLVGLGYPDGAVVARWRPRWSGDDLETGISRETSPLVDDVEEHHEWTREAARFAVVLGLLLDAEGVPFRIETERPDRRPRARGGAPGGPRDWTVRHVYLDEVPLAHGGGGSGGGGDELGDRLPEQVAVRGHLKRQRYGARRSEVRWIYVASYEARRWVAPRPTRIVVSRDRTER